MNIKFRSSLVIVIAILLSVGSISAHDTGAVPHASSSVTAGRADSAKEAALRAAMRKLWEDHITWTRLFIVSAIGDLPDKTATSIRLLQNQTDIGNAVKSFYGDAAGEKLTGLLKTHITTAAELVAAAKANDTAKMGDAKKRWYANADEIAVFLSGANPKNWPAEEMKGMMRGHLDLTAEEAVAHLKKDWAADIAAYDNIHNQILDMADMLSTGIIKQFPEKFK